MPLTELPVGGEAVIERLDLEESDVAMLRAMGVLEGQAVRLLRIAAFGGPLQVRVGETSFALARALASSITVRVP
jgi:Fe2+ transport system protein FeoA